MTSTRQRVALVTGGSRRGSIGAAIVRLLAHDGWDVAFTGWRAYDAGRPWGGSEADALDLEAAVQRQGRRAVAVDVDLTKDGAAVRLLDHVTEELGSPAALVLAHTHSVASSLLDTTTESFDRHFAVNVRASFHLVREFCGRRLDTGGRIVALTSDHAVGNLPYGASKAALDRIVTAAGIELADHGFTGNAVNPGPTDTGWVTDDRRPHLLAKAPAGRLSTPQDAANLVAFLLSDRGGWINGQVLQSNGGWSLAP